MTSNAYVLKYNIKYALNDPKVREADRQTIIQTQKECNLMHKIYYGYAFADTLLSFYFLRKSYGANSHAFRKMLAKHVFFLTVRLVAVYEFVEYSANTHLEQRVRPVLEK